MKTLLPVLTLLTLFTSIGQSATLFMGAYPDSIIVFDETKGQIVDRIRLSTGLPTSMRLSQDRKKIYVTTNDHSGVEVLDAATHKVINHFVLNTPTKRYRFNGGVPDPQDKLFYTVTTEMNKLNDRYEIGKPKYTVIDLAEQKIVRTADIARFDLSTRQVNFTPIGPSPEGMAGLQVAPDKKNAYTVITNGTHGNKRCEFWTFDLATNHITQTSAVPCRSRFSFGMAGDGKK